jgi:hypothetical protein
MSSCQVAQWVAQPGRAFWGHTQPRQSQHNHVCNELSCLAPDIVTAVLDGKQPNSLTAMTLRTEVLPISWDEQRLLLEMS